MAWSASFGDRTSFMFSFEILGDPHVAGDVTECEASWGKFEIWVNGVNLCSHVELDQQLDGVHWYLLPLFKWFAENWDPIFHEEQMALSGQSRRGDFPKSGAAFLRDALDPPQRIEHQDLDEWEDAWYAWWSRHHLWAARYGGLFPYAVFRRYREDVEVSWLASVPKGAPASYRFLNSGGIYRARAESIAGPIYSALRAFVSWFSERFAESDDAYELRRRFEAITAPGSAHARVPWLIGLGRTYDQMSERWSALAEALPELGRRVGDGITVPSIVSPSTQTAILMFGSVSPDISMEDALKLGRVIVDDYQGARVPSLVDELSRDDLISQPPSITQPWENGYDLAATIREEYVDQAPDERLDLFALLERLGVKFYEAELSDPDLRGVSIAGSRYAPLIVLNSKSAYNGSNGGKRFSTAHELCHLLADRSFGGELGIVSNNWAPREIERRANAFAAMLLMPEPAVFGIVGGKPFLSRQDLDFIARQFETTAHAVRAHLWNLGFISRSNYEVLQISNP